VNQLAENRLTRRIVFDGGFALVVIICLIAACGTGYAQTYDALRIDGRPEGVLYDSGGMDPIIDVNTFTEVTSDGSLWDDINGPSIIRVPEWLSDAEKINPAAHYYMYFADHRDDSIRLAWSESLTSEWHLFNYGSAPSQAWGVGGNNTGSETPGNGVLDLDLGSGGIVINDDHIDIGGGVGGADLFAVGNHLASPDVLIDDVNQRIVMYFHGPNQGDGPSGQQTFVATSSNGLNFNLPSEGGQAGQGIREVIPGSFYFRTFEVSGSTFAYSNKAELYRAPAFNDANQTNTIANADTEGGLWNPSGSPNSANTWWEQMSTASNPIERLYLDHGQGVDDPRHFAVYSRTHLDPSDTNLYVFYTSKFDTPESVFLTVIDTDNGSTDPADWDTIGQRLILEPELDWEGADLPLQSSKEGPEINVRQLRDPYVFEDTLGTPDPSDDHLYLFYTGEGEEAIGMAELFFDPLTPNTALPQGDLIPPPPPGPPNGIVGDVNQNGVVFGDGTGPAESDDLTAFIEGWLSTGYTTQYDMYTHGDMNLDGITNIWDAHIFNDALRAAGGSFSFDLLYNRTPEPATAWLACVGFLALCAGSHRRPRLGRH